MEQSIQQLMDWLNNHLNETIAIEKKELRDLDKVHFNLEAVDFRSADDVIDEYLGSALILRGFGSTLNADGELVSLPQSTYDLAVEGLQIVDLADRKAEITTDRANYTLSVD
ncbi:hypothetical protein BSK49_22575 [Paenibacillus odorifer]|jgi:hypothetical protein|uniref:hypothetical protein n=1 Tax=Paenibacillus TaxID=44249 RepID=UPI00096E689A|nr:hypothetical protein [Paenibacillus odorifer]OMD59174.1 hypothetical protein BSK55_10595 [Paenibacillus odorifer]OMD84083.1 hypothetical protein BSK49_22575 [Paenibacillus odorifer]